MENITGSWIIAGSMKAHGESTETKAFRLKVKFQDVPTMDIISKALEGIKIQWVNGVGRKNWDKYQDNQVIEIDFKAPGKAPQIDPKEAVAAQLASMTPEQQQAYIAELLGQTK